jgi:hypothetical protein
MNTEGYSANETTLFKKVSKEGFSTVWNKACSNSDLGAINFFDL